MNANEYGETRRVFLLCGISVVRMLSLPFFSIFLFHIQMTAIKAGQSRAKQRAPLNALSSRRERNKGRSDSSGRERERQTLHFEAVHLQTIFRTNTLPVFISAFVHTRMQTDKCSQDEHQSVLAGENTEYKDPFSIRTRH